MKTAKELTQSLDPIEFMKRARGGEIPFDSEEKKPGIIIPNATQMPNEILDYYMAGLSGAEYKVLSYIVRKTFGYNKGDKGDKIPMVQLINGTIKANGEHQDYGTGLSERSIREAVKSLEAAGLIEVIREKINKDTNEINFYKLITRAKYL